MIGKIIGALVGAEIEKKRQQNGLKGAVIGAMAVGAMRRLGPIGLLLGGAYVAKKVLSKKDDGTPA